MVDDPIVSVVVPAYNAAATIGATLLALRGQDLDGPYEVIVVDDGSSDGTRTVVSAAGEGVQLVRQAHEGPAAARNHGVRVARAPLIAFTDSDCVPEPGWLRAGVDALGNSDLVQGRVLPDAAGAAEPFGRTIIVRREYGLYQAANLFVRRELFERLGGFEDWLRVSIGKPLAEDVWFGWSARRAGARTAFSDAATVRHAVFPRGAGAYALERLRLVYFPAMVARMPELREVFLYRRWFLTRRTAALDLALGAAAGALATRRAGMSRRAAVLPLVAAIPYARELIVSARRGGRPVPIVVAADLLADATGLAALAVGSLRALTPVL